MDQLLIEHGLAILGEELIIHPGCKRKHFVYDDPSGYLHECCIYVIAHNIKYTEVRIMADVDKETNKFRASVNMKLKNKYSLQFNVVERSKIEHFA